MGERRACAGAGLWQSQLKTTPDNAVLLETVRRLTQADARPPACRGRLARARRGARASSSRAARACRPHRRRRCAAATDEPFAIDGRLSARRGNDAVAVAFAWTHAPPRDEFVVTTPLGGSGRRAVGRRIDASRRGAHRRRARRGRERLGDADRARRRLPAPRRRLGVLGAGRRRVRTRRTRRKSDAAGRTGRAAPGRLRDRLRLCRRCGAPPVAAPRSRATISSCAS